VAEGSVDVTDPLADAASERDSVMLEVPDNVDVAICGRLPDMLGVGGRLMETVRDIDAVVVGGGDTVAVIVEDVVRAEPVRVAKLRDAELLAVAVGGALADIDAVDEAVNEFVAVAVADSVGGGDTVAVVVKLVDFEIEVVLLP
jgi:hypothetical protein